MDNVINYIKSNGFVDCPVTNAEIRTSLKLSEQTVRKHINEARSRGVPICSCQDGYYYSEDKLEILRTIQSLMHRTMAVEKAVNGMLTCLHDKVGPI